MRNFWTSTPPRSRQRWMNPDKSRIDEMLAFAEKAEREYAAEAAAYVQTPADIAEQAQAVPRDTFSIYQLKSGNETLDYRFEPLDAIRNNGLSVKPENYELVYTAPLTEQDSLESIYTRFNIDRPADFKGHSLSVSDIVVLHQDGKDTAHYCDRFRLFPGARVFAAGTGSGGHDPHAGSDGDAGADQHTQRQLLCDQYDAGTNGGGGIWGSPSV